jgi:PIN domain
MQLQPDVRLGEAIDRLAEIQQEIQLDLHNLYSDSADRRWQHYLEWCGRTERTLRQVFVNTTLVDAIQSPRHWHLQGAVPAAWARELVGNELRYLDGVFLQELDHLKLFLPLEGRTGRPLLFDTNVWAHFAPLDGRIGRDEWIKITGAPNGAEFWVVIPVVTLDELDRLAHNRDRKQNSRPRQARNSIAPFVGRLLSPQPAAINSWMTVDVLPDPPGQRQNPDGDMELLERAQFLCQVTGSRVTVVTSDQGMEVRGGAMGLVEPRSKVQIVAMPESYRLPD